MLAGSLRGGEHGFLPGLGVMWNKTWLEGCGSQCESEEPALGNNQVMPSGADQRSQGWERLLGVVVLRASGVLKHLGPSESRAA